VDASELLPRDKSDVARAQAAVAAGYPAVAPIVGSLVEWLQDANWPVARVLIPLLQSIGEPLVPHIRHVLSTDDLIWKYWTIGLLVPSLSQDAAAPFRDELERLARRAEPRELLEALDQQAASALQHFGWS
jgi:Domain of unknown function (DUF5071)